MILWSQNCFTRAHSQKFMTCRSVCRTSVFKIPPSHIFPRENPIFPLLITLSSWPEQPGLSSPEGDWEILQHKQILAARLWKPSERETKEDWSHHYPSLYYHTVNLSHCSLLLHQPPGFLVSIFGWVGPAATPRQILTDPKRISHIFPALPRYYRQELQNVGASQCRHFKILVIVIFRTSE